MGFQSIQPSGSLQFQFALAFFLPICQVVATIALVVIAVQQVKIAKRLKQILEDKNNK